MMSRAEYGQMVDRRRGNPLPPMETRWGSPCLLRWSARSYLQLRHHCLGTTCNGVCSCPTGRPCTPTHSRVFLGTMAQQSSWPGERQPSDRDIELGIESLDAGFLSQFKDALRAKAVGTEDEPLMQMRLDALVR